MSLAAEKSLGRNGQHPITMGHNEWAEDNDAQHSHLPVNWLREKTAEPPKGPGASAPLSYPVLLQENAISS